MNTEIIVAIVGALAIVIVAIIASVESSRRSSVARERAIIDKIDSVRKDLAAEISDNCKQLICIALKVDTLWEIYGEEVIRQARNSGMIASRSAEVPTEEWNTLVSEDLSGEIQDRAASLADELELANELESPYDIFVEIWQVYKEELVQISRDKNISVSTVTSGVLQICGNVVDSRA